MIRGPSHWLVWGSFFVGLVFEILPLPAAIDPVRPFLLAMILVYWLMEAPTRVGFASAFFVGILADLVSASLLGEQAFRLIVLAWLVQRFRARLRFFPLWQQAVTVGLLLLNDRLLAWVIHAVAGSPAMTWTWWLAPLLGVLLWPWLYVLIDLARLRARERG